MLQGGNPLTVGVGIVIEVIRKNNSDYDPENVGGPDSVPTTYDPIYLGTLLCLFADRIPDFMDLILSSKHNVIENGKVRRVDRGQLNSAWGAKVEPLGFDRFKTCELMAELLHCSNMGLLNEPGSDDYVRQRDAERERLLAAANPQRDLSDADAAKATEIDANARTTNPVEAVSFEDVSASAVLVEGEGGARQESVAEKAEPRTEGAMGKDDSGQVRPTGTKPQDSKCTSPTTRVIDQLRKTNLDDDLKAAENQSPSDAPLLSPHPEDVPAPLSTPQSAKGLSTDAASSVPAEEAAEQTSEQEKASTEATGNSIDELARQCTQADVNGRPVVGDYLKIMFVDHRVVPSILVSCC